LVHVAGDGGLEIRIEPPRVFKKRSPGLFSAQRVARARGFWLIALLLFNLVLWGGLGWIALHLLRFDPARFGGWWPRSLQRYTGDPFDLESRSNFRPIARKTAFHRFWHGPGGLRFVKTDKSDPEEEYED
jgi:hypothetical protein